MYNICLELDERVFTVGQVVDAMDKTRNWHTACIVAVKDVTVRVHYTGWDSKWDEWIQLSSSRIQPAGTRI